VIISNVLNSVKYSVKTVGNFENGEVPMIWKDFNALTVENHKTNYILCQNNQEPRKSLDILFHGILSHAIVEPDFITKNNKCNSNSYHLRK